MVGGKRKDGMEQKMGCVEEVPSRPQREGYFYLDGELARHVVSLTTE